MFPSLFMLIIALVAIGIGWVVKRLPSWAQLTLLIVCSLGLAWLQWSVAKAQLSTLGFAAHNRDPNYVGEYVGYALAILGILNIGIAAKNLRYGFYVLVVVAASLPIMYLISW